MAPKKKKQALAKVHRGFATTSIPKKVETISETAVEQAKDEALPHQSTNENGKSDREDEGQEGWEAENEEETALQQLADKIKPAAEKEISRTLKVCSSWCHSIEQTWLSLSICPQVIEYEKRISSTYSPFWWDDGDLVNVCLPENMTLPPSDRSDFAARPNHRDCC
jgi:hypothetical protein